MWAKYTCNLLSFYRTVPDLCDIIFESSILRFWQNICKFAQSTHNSVFRSVLFFFVIISVQQVYAQPLAWIGKPKPYKWMIGVSWNTVDDDGRGFCQTFDVNEVWNTPVFPARFMVDRYLKKGLSIEFAGAYNNYTNNKRINDTTGLSGLFLSFDLNAKYSFYNLLNTPRLDPYVSAGVGLTHRSALETPLCPTLQVGAGLNFWIWRGLGLQIQASGKFGLAGEIFGENDYLHYTAGFVYKFKGDRADNSFNDRKYKWINKRERYKSGKRKG